MPQAPSRVQEFAAEHNDVFSAFRQLSEQCHKSGPLDEKTRRLVKVALAIGAGLEGATHSAVRHAVESGVTRQELEHVVILGITTLGWPSSFRNLTWVRDVLEPNAR